jgi:hypothetical protein
MGTAVEKTGTFVGQLGTDRSEDVRAEGQLDG